MKIISRKELEKRLTQEGKTLSKEAKIVLADSDLKINFPAVGFKRWEGFDASYSSGECDILISVEPGEKRISIYDSKGVTDAKKLQERFAKKDIGQVYELVSYF